ncbi:nucleoside hydrolase [Actinomyces sp. B33]|uniref:uridine-preferring nucleoside hydrolase UriH n=1 Tax=Actinomyces sp. B33 TaxID=2942131 RepID=UPI0023422047|nr:nucleoside hydrolase [Actinomyces sp. B33]MDC4233746.1 nucleoside hydrolase [Actinomyces sp. B33]
MQQRKVLLDCDPGHDDAIAMILAWGDPRIDLVGVTTVGGNQTLDKVTRNALAVATVVGMHDVPIAAGCPRPLVRPTRIAPECHGESGLDGVDLPEPVVRLDPRHGVDLIIDTVMAHEPDTITLVPTGPLTNIAMAARKEPRIVERVREVVLMGGGCHVGNLSAAAEYNIAVDPEAAHIVFSEDWPLVMVGLDLTHQALATDDVVSRIAAVPGPVSDFVLGLLAFFRESHRIAQGFDVPPVHDPCTLAYLIDPTIVETVPVPLSVELTGTHTLGMTVADFRSPAPPDCRTRAATRLDHHRFWGLVVDAIDRIQKEGR